MILPRYRLFRVAFALPGAPTDVDGLPQFPGLAKLRTGGFTGVGSPSPPITSALAIQTNLVTPTDVAGLRALSVQTGYRGVNPLPQAFPLLLTCNAFAVDTTPGTHEYRWFFSQRIEAEKHDPNPVVDPDSVLAEPAHRRPTERYFTFNHASVTQSGTVRIDVVPENVRKLIHGFGIEGEGPPGLQDLEDHQLGTLFKNVHVYVQRLSDKAYQWAPVYAVPLNSRN